MLYQKKKLGLTTETEFLEEVVALNKKKAEELLKQAENVLNQTQNTSLQNEEELKRLTLNIQVIDEQVAKLKG